MLNLCRRARRASLYSSRPRASSARTTLAMTARWFIIDTDAGVDDAVALTMAIKLASQYENAVMKMIITSHGNCSEEQVFHNVTKCLHSTATVLTDRVKLVRGASKPLSCAPIDASYFHGMDGFGDVPKDVLDYPENFQDDMFVSDEDVPSAIISLCQEAKSNPIPVEVILVTLGPLTNLAMTLQRIENVHELLNKVFIMGGSSNGRGNVTRTAEFNLYADPEAAELVFQAFSTYWPDEKVVVISWDLCLKYCIPWAVYDELIRRNDVDYKTNMTNIGIFLRSICWLSFVEKRVSNDSNGDDNENGGKRGNGGAVICDMLAVAIALNYSSLVSSVEKCHIDVELQGKHTRGTTICDYGHCYDQVDRDRRIIWVSECDSTVLIHMFGLLFV